jgi:3-isopropylmalate/(R)-2-methylmalate dehydratase small subunit
MMQPFLEHEGLVAPLDRRDVDTDQIIPQRFLRKIARTGFGPDLFANLRYLGDDATPNPDFVLNQPRYAGASILLARDNFGGGSSREHAPWALQEYGFRVLIAPSFADIFYNNCLGNGLLPVVLAPEEVDALFAAVAAQEGYRLRVSLPEQTVTTPDGTVYRFAIDAFRKEALLRGLDAIGWTEQYSSAIDAYEARRRDEASWLFVSG